MLFLDKLKEPVFLRESNSSEAHLEKLKTLHGVSQGEMRKQIELDMKLLNYGIAGEKTVIFELRNSFMPMLVLHDLFLDYKGLTAQIDFLVITKKKVFILECKNLFGNLEVNSNGDFIRTIEINGKMRKEGIYSPITQNQRHMDVLRNIRRESKSNFISRSIFDSIFDDNYKSVVVIANPKTVINMKYAKKEIKNSIIRSDKLIDYIKIANSDKKEGPIPDKRMYEMAEEFLSYHKENEVDYTKKYEQFIVKQDIEEAKPVNDIVGSIEDTEIYKELKGYRLNKSKEGNIKAFYIYNNLQMEDLIRKMPGNIEELLKVSGFNEVKCSKYGADIINIISRFR